MKRIVVFCFFAIIAICSFGGTVKLEYLRTEHNVMHNGQKCMAMHFKVETNGYKDKKLELSCYFKDSNKTYLKDKNGHYCSKFGEVNSAYFFTPPYDNTIYKDFVIYMPNNEIHPLPEKNTYYIEAILWYGTTRLVTINCDSFTMTGATKSNQNNKNNNNSNNNNGKKDGGNANGIARSYRENSNSGYKIVTVYENGSRKEEIYTICPSCFGSKKCRFCGGQGGTYLRYFIPCTICGQSGKCMGCREDGHNLSEIKYFDSKGNRVHTPSYPVINSSGNSGSNSGGSSKGNNRSNDNRYGYYACPTCHGTGTCQTCHGTGIADSYYTAGSMECPNCKTKKGRCSVCGGTGQKYGVVK